MLICIKDLQTSFRPTIWLNKMLLELGQEAFIDQHVASKVEDYILFN